MKKYGLEFLANIVLIIFTFIQHYHFWDWIFLAVTSNLIMFHEFVLFLFEKYLAERVKNMFKFVSQWVKFSFKIAIEEVKKHGVLYLILLMIIVASGCIIYFCNPSNKIFGVGQGILGGIPIMIGQLLIEKERERKAEKEKREITKGLLKGINLHVEKHVNTLDIENGIDTLIEIECIEYEKLAMFSSLVEEFNDSNFLLLDKKTKEIFISLINHEFVQAVKEWGFANADEINSVKKTDVSELIFEPLRKGNRKNKFKVTEPEIKKYRIDYIEKLKLLLN